MLKYITKDLHSITNDGREPPFSLKSQSLGKAMLTKIAQKLKDTNTYPLTALDILQTSAFYYLQDEIKETQDYKTFNGGFHLISGAISINTSEQVIKRINQRNNDRNLGSVSLTAIKLHGSLNKHLLKYSYPHLKTQLDTFLKTAGKEFFTFHQQRIKTLAETSHNIPLQLEHSLSEHSTYMTQKEYILAKQAQQQRAEERKIYAL
jgi:hypothetical protein